MDLVQTVDFKGEHIRTIPDGMETWFVLPDVLRALDTSTPTTVAVQTIREGMGDGVIVVKPIPDARGRVQETTLITWGAAAFLVSNSRTEKGRRLNMYIFQYALQRMRKDGHVFDPSLSDVERAEACYAHLSTLSKAVNAEAITRVLSRGTNMMTIEEGKDLIGRHTTAALKKPAGYVRKKVLDRHLVEFGFVDERGQLTAEGVKFGRRAPSGVIEWSPLIIDELQKKRFPVDYSYLLTSD